MGTPDGQEVLAGLIQAYEEEANLYAGLEEAAIEQREVLLNGRDPERLNQIIERQRHLAEHIGKIEAGIAPLRAYWEQVRDAACGSHMRHLADSLDRLLEELADRIHTIVTIEKQNSRALLMEAAFSEV